MYARYDRKQVKYLSDSVRVFCNYYVKLRSDMMGYGWKECTMDDLNEVFMSSTIPLTGLRGDIQILYRANRLRNLEIKLEMLNGFNKVFYRTSFDDFEEYLWDRYEIDAVDLDYSSQGLRDYSDTLRMVSIETSNRHFIDYARLESNTFRGVSEFMEIGNKVMRRIKKYTADYYAAIDLKYAVEKAVMQPNDYLIWRERKCGGLQDNLDRVFLAVELGSNIILN